LLQGTTLAKTGFETKPEIRVLGRQIIYIQNMISRFPEPWPMTEDVKHP